MASQAVNSPNQRHDSISIQPGQTVNFTFDVSSASFARQGQDLALNMENGNQLTLEGFFVPDSSGKLPDLVLQDGTTVSSSDFLASIDPDMDLSPAADSATSGGINSYSDNAGDLVAGLEGSGSLEGIQWASSAGSGEYYVSSSQDEPSDLASAMPEPPAPPVVPPVTPPVVPPVVPPVEPPVGPNGPYEARAVFYDNQDQANGDSFNFRIPAAGGSTPVIESRFGFIDVTSLNFTLDTNGNPVYTLQLSGEGRQAMADALAAAGGDSSTAGNVYDYITITINGQSYVMQVVLNQSGQYSAAAEDALNQPGTSTGTILGEWHTEHNQMKNSGRVSSEGGDEIWLNDGMNGSNNLNAGNGDNTVHVTGWMNADGKDNALQAGSGQDTVNISGYMYAKGGNNTINLGAGDDEINIVAGVYASNGLNVINTGEGNDQINIGGDVHVNSGRNDINTGSGNDSLNIDGWVYAFNGGHNQINLGDGNDTMTVGEQIYTDATSSNSVNLGEGDNTLSIDRGSLWAIGGQNTVTGGNGNNTISTTYEMSASQGASNKITTGSGDDKIDFGTNMRADNATNTINAGDGDNKVKFGYEMTAYNGGTNTILTGSGDDDIRLGWHMKAENGDNVINAGNGDNYVKVGGSNTIDTGTGADDITINGWVYGTDGGKNVINTVDGDINVNGSVYLYEETGTSTASSNTLTAGGNINITNTDNSTHINDGVQAFRHDTTNTLTAGGDIVIDIQNRTAGSKGVYSEGETAVNELRAEGSISITSYSDTSNNTDGVPHEAMGVFGNQSGKVDITAKTGDITIKSTGLGNSNATALSGGPNTSLTADQGRVILEAHGARSSAGIFNGGTISAASLVSVIASSDAGNSMGLHARGGKADIDVHEEGGKAEIHAFGQGVNNHENGAPQHVYGILGGNNSHINIDAHNIEVQAAVTGSSSSFDAYGMHMDGFSTNTAASTTLTGHNISVSASMAEGSTGTAYAMYAKNVGSSIGKEGSNIIQAASDDHAIVVTIRAEAGTTGEAVAMFASGGGAINKIVGSNEGDTITIDGDLRAELGGINLIDAGNGDNTIKITGDISGTDSGHNRVITGDGDDTITLNGAVEPGSLTVITGGGYDTLVLVADNVDDFNNFYKGWLESATEENFSGVDSINVSVGGDVDLGSLSWISDTFSDIDVSFNGGDGFDTLNIDGFGNGSLALSELVDMVDGFEVIDLGGSNGNQFTIDSLLDGLGIDTKLDSDLLTDNSLAVDIDLLGGTVLRVNGDAEDSVVIGGEWNSQSAGTVTYDNITYNVYTTDLQSEQYLLVQQALVS